MRKQQIDSELSQPQLEKELKRVQKRHRRGTVMKSVLLGVLILTALLAAAERFYCPVLQIADNRMRPLLESGQAVLAVRTQEFRNGDLVAFYEEGSVRVGWIDDDIADPTQAPDHRIVVLGTEKKESRHVPIDTIAGKVILRIWPLDQLRYLEMENE